MEAWVKLDQYLGVIEICSADVLWIQGMPHICFGDQRFVVCGCKACQ